MVRASLLALAVVSSTLLVVGEADACSGRCDLAKFPAEGRTVPAGFTLLPAPFTGPLEVRDASGTSVFSGTTRSGLVDFGVPLPEGRYELTHTPQGCGDATTERSFEVGPAAPLPTSAGDLKQGAVTQVPARAGEDGVGACDPYGSPPLASLDVWLAPTAELIPYLPLARFEVVVDGSVIGLPRYVSEAGLAVARTTLVVTCEAPPTGWRQTGYVVTAGRHRIDIRGELVDGRALPAAGGDVELACGPGTGDANAAASPPPGAGCSAAPRSAPPRFAAFALLATIAFAARRRRG